MSAALPLSALVIVAAIISRFPPVAAVLPASVLQAVPLAVGAVLGLVGAVERRTPRREVGPLWMRLGRPLSLCLALGLTYFTTVFAQELGLSLGPSDPTFPAGANPTTATTWFFVFTLGFLGVGMMSAPTLLVPLLRVLTAPFTRAKPSMAVFASMAFCAGFALCLLVGAHTSTALDVVALTKSFFDAHATAGSLVLVGIGVLPNLVPSSQT